jgi:hypothetical protein
VAFVAVLAGMLLLAPSAGGVPGDPTPPVVTPVITRGALGANGWYISPVTVRWDVSDPESQILSTVGCDTWAVENDTREEARTCSATTDAWQTSVTKKIKLDKTPPSTATHVERQPDANGWYNRPLTVVWTGTDVTSGIDGCSSARYAGPDTAGATVAGSCKDFAGNTTSNSLSFKYDATAPRLFAVTSRRGNRIVEISWRRSTDTKLVEVLRAPGRGREGESMVYRGSKTGFRDTGLVVGRKYEYRVSGIDDAANRAEHKFTLIATGPLLSPVPGERVTSPPYLVWTPVRRASYYNLQLIRGGRKILSAWPLRPGYRLRRTWTYKGRRYRLRPGVYRWYVWPGYGRISAAQYAQRPLGSSTFVVSG